LFFEFGRPLLSNTGQVQEYCQVVIEGLIKKEHLVLAYISQMEYKHVGQRWKMVDYKIPSMIAAGLSSRTV
jgi:hypothetical protein